MPGLQDANVWQTVNSYIGGRNNYLLPDPSSEAKSTLSWS